MAILAGIDEAGYGPILGPLVVSSTVFQIPDDQIKADLWCVLKDAVASNKKHLKGRLFVADSKKVYTRSAGIGHLRRSVLSALWNLPTTHPEGIHTAGQLLRILCPDCTSRLSQYAWYADLHAARLGAERDDIQIASGVLHRSLQKQSMQLLHMSSYCFDVAHYNHMVTVVNNKASVLFTAVCTLIQRILIETKSQSGPIQIVVDRQSARSNYIRHLDRMFPSAQWKVLKEDGTTSSYEMILSGRTCRLHFVTKGDDKFLPVALASMTSKYLREVLVMAINSYFLAHCSEIKPTAGYWKDGQRFLRDINEYVPHITYEKNQLIRCR